MWPADWFTAAVATYRYVIADVFTDTPLTGNQLAVFTDAREIPEEQLQPLAKEMNYSETVFVYTPEADGHARIRIFTPSSELPFAGHPVLGTAFVLAGPLQLPEIRLETGQGVVPVALDRDEPGRIVFGRMQQPIPKVEAFDTQAELFAALGIEGSELPVELYDLGIRHVYVGLAERGGRRRARARLRGRSTRAHRDRRRQLLRGLRDALEDAHVRARRRSARGPGHWLGGRPARRPPRPPRPHRPSASRSRSPRASRSAARARSTPRSKDRPSRWSGSRSAARRSSSPAASSASRAGRRHSAPRDVVDLGELDSQGAPEAAAVAGDE